MAVYRWEWVNGDERRLTVRKFNNTLQDWETGLDSVTLVPGSTLWNEWWEHHMFILQHYQLVTQAEINSEQMAYLCATPKVKNGRRLAQEPIHWRDDSYGARMATAAEPFLSTSHSTEV